MIWPRHKKTKLSSAYLLKSEEEGQQLLQSGHGMMIRECVKELELRRPSGMEDSIVINDDWL